MKLVLFLVFCSLSVYVFFASYNLPPFLFQPLGGDGYARIVAVLLVIASVVWFSLTVIVPRFSLRGGGSDRQQISASGRADGGTTIVWFATVMMLYSLSVFTVGYFVSTFAFLFCSMLLIVENRRSNWMRLLALSASITAVLFLLFRTVRLYLPDALLF